MRDASQSPRTEGEKHLSSPRPCLPEPLSLPFPPSAPLARGAFFPLFSPTLSPWAPLCPTTSSLLSSRKAKPNSCIRKKSVSGRWFPDLFTHRHRIRGHRTLQLCLPSPLGVWGPMGFCAGRTCLGGWGRGGEVCTAWVGKAGARLWGGGANRDPGPLLPCVSRQTLAQGEMAARPAPRLGVRLLALSLLQLPGLHSGGSPLRPSPLSGLQGREVSVHVNNPTWVPLATTTGIPAQE